MVRNHIKGVPGVGADAIDPSTYLGAFNLLHAAPRDGASFFPSFFPSFFLPLSLSLSPSHTSHLSIASTIDEMLTRMRRRRRPHDAADGSGTAPLGADTIRYPNVERAAL